MALCQVLLTIRIATNELTVAGRNERRHAVAPFAPTNFLTARQALRILEEQSIAADAAVSLHNWSIGAQASVKLHCKIDSANDVPSDGAARLDEPVEEFMDKFCGCQFPWRKESVGKFDWNYVHADSHSVVAPADKDALNRANVAIVAAPSDHYVRIVYECVISWIEVDPAER